MYESNHRQHRGHGRPRRIEGDSPGGGDLTAYRNHVYRVANLCFALSPSTATEAAQKIAIAAAFHDIGIWTDGTFDYLAPSVRSAAEYLTRSAKAAWIPEVACMIGEHHKISAFRGDLGPLVECFRQADWIDVSMGLIRFGLERGVTREIFSTWPNAGFHRLLLKLSLKRFVTDPLTPLPMVKL